MENRDHRTPLEFAGVLETTATLYEDNEDLELRAIAACCQIFAEVIAQGRIQELYQAIAILRQGRDRKSAEIRMVKEAIKEKEI